VPNVRESGTGLSYRLPWRTGRSRVQPVYCVIASGMNRMIDA
jgi:hypothetical protein